MCIAQDHFTLITLLIVYITVVVSLSQILVLLSLHVILSILLSILVCATARLFYACRLSVQASAPYARAGCSRPYTVHLVVVQADGKVARRLADVAQPAMILCRISYPGNFQ